MGCQNKEEEQELARFDAVFPCILSIMPAAVFNKKDPIVLGVDVVEGIAKVGWRCSSMPDFAGHHSLPLASIARLSRALCMGVILVPAGVMFWEGQKRVALPMGGRACNAGSLATSCGACFATQGCRWLLLVCEQHQGS